MDGTYAGCIYSGYALDIHTVSRAVYVRRWTVHTQAVFTPDVFWTYTQYHGRCTYGGGRYIRKLYLLRMCSGHIHTVSRAVYVRRWTVHTQAVFTPDVLWTYTQYHGRCMYGGGRYIRKLYLLRMCSGHSHSITGGVCTAVDGTYAGCIYSGRALDIHTVSRAVYVRR